MLVFLKATLEINSQTLTEYRKKKIIHIQRDRSVVFLILYYMHVSILKALLFLTCRIGSKGKI